MRNSNVFNSITKKKNLSKVLSKSKSHLENWDANMSSSYLILLRKDRKFLQGRNR